MPLRPPEWDEQDWLLVAQALAETRWHRDLDEDRAFEMLAGIAATLDLTPSECIRDRE